MANPYAQQQRTSLENAPPQAAEGWALVEMARRLEALKETPDDLENIRTQVRTNWRIWTIFQANLVDPECTVPREIRENLLNLSNFIDKRSVELISDPKVEKTQVLVNINRQIGAGLMGSPSDDPEEAERLRREHATRVQSAGSPAGAQPTPSAPASPQSGTDHSV